MGNGQCCLPADAVTSADVQTDIDIAKLVLPPRPWHFPLQSCRGGRAGGQLLLFLDRVHNVPCRLRLAGLNCQSAALEIRSRPWVRAWTQGKHAGIAGHMVEWPARAAGSGASPVWHSAKALGAPLASALEEGASLCLELWDGDTALGSLATLLKDVPVHRHVTHELESASEITKEVRSTVSFQLLASSAFRERRVVYFVRHAESVWNQAQDSMQLHAMARTTDHSLSARGRDQAEALSRRLTREAKHATAVAAEILQPDVIYASPLTRAIQTAVIALGPGILMRRSLMEMVLMASAREKQNLGGLDTMSTKIGLEVLQNALDELQELYGGEDCAVLGSFSHLRFDIQDVQDCWWFEGAAESPADLEARMQEFMAQLLYSPHRSIVVVGHSCFFQAVFGRYLSTRFCTDNRELARDLQERKLMNCGVARVELDPQRGTSRGPIVGVELVLGTDFVSEYRPGLLGCCRFDLDDMDSEVDGSSPSLGS